MAYRPATLAMLLLAGTLSTVGCGEPEHSAARSGDSRFELQHDKQGRLVRLDKTSGEVTVVDTPATRAESPTRRTREKQPTSSTPPPTTPSDAAASACGNEGLTKVSVALSAAPVFIQPQQLPTPLVTLAIGTDLPVVKAEGDWYLVRFDDKRWGPRVGYIHCASVVATRTAENSAAKDRAATEKALLSPPATDVPVSVERAPLIGHMESKSSTASPPQPKVRTERLNGYVEWRRPNYVIADGQRVHWDDHTQLTIGHYPDVQSLPLGYEIAVKGYRVADGSLVAEELQATPNGIAAFENEMRNACDQVERSWIQAGVAFDQDRTGSIYEIGRIETSGPRVSRAASIIGRLLPPYVNPRSVRIYVVDTRGWNASAMANGAVFVYSGLMDDMSDSELAVVLGHELAHYTHEHGRRQQRNTGLVRLATAATSVALDHMHEGGKQDTFGVASTVSLRAWKNGYGRDLEDQADRVGLRYAYEAGFDINVAPRMWQRLGEHSGDFDVVSNFFLGDHSRSADRKRNAERELRLNYSQAATSADSNR